MFFLLQLEQEFEHVTGKSTVAFELRLRRDMALLFHDRIVNKRTCTIPSYLGRLAFQKMTSFHERTGGLVPAEQFPPTHLAALMVAFLCDMYKGDWYDHLINIEVSWITIRHLIKA